MLFIFGECGGVSVDFIYGVRERAVFFGVGVCFAASVAGFSWILFTACGSVPSFLCGKCFAWARKWCGSCGRGALCLRSGGAERPFRGGFERKTSEKTRVRALSGDVTGRGVQFKSKKKQFMRDAFTSRC